MYSTSVYAHSIAGWRPAKSDFAMTLKSAQESDKPLGSAAEAAQENGEQKPDSFTCPNQEPGIRRLRVSKGFRYVTPENELIDAAADLKRMASLGHTTRLRDVWICTDPRGHLQATGHDARGRKQYRYHPEWRDLRDTAKFERMVAFGEALPRLRRRCGAISRYPTCHVRRCWPWSSACSTKRDCASVMPPMHARTTAMV